MSRGKTYTPIEPIEHPAEPQGNAVRTALAAVEPRSMRTYTPTMAIIERSEGCYHWTVDGRKLADFTSGVLVANLGHNPPGWWRRVMRYLGADDSAGATPSVPLTTYNAATPLEVEASERLVESLRSQPGGARMEQVLWSASGTEGVTKAIRAALSVDPGRQLIMATRAGFHGKKGLAAAVTGTEQDPERDPRVRFIGFPCQECYSLDLRKQSLDLASYREELDRLDAEDGDRICCLVTEPYLGGGGSYHPQPEYLQSLQDYCRQRDIAFVLDEVQSNFGRTGTMYAFTRYGIEPDLVVLGKGMANGVPMNAVAGRADLLGTLNFGEGSDTWSGHSLGLAAVLATLDEFEAGNVLSRAQGLSTVLEAGLRRLTELPAVAAIRGEGTVWGIQCAAIGTRTSSDVACEFVKACYLGNGGGRAIHLLGPLAGDVIRVAPPLVMDPGEANEYLQAMYEIGRQLSN